VVVDLFDRGAVGRVVGGMDAVCNLATAVPPGFRGVLPWSWREMDRIRSHVSANLVEAGLATDTVQRIVQESFAPLYADRGEAWLDETAPIRPARYNCTARVAEENNERFTRSGRAGVVLRFGLFYGPGDPFTQQLLDGVRRGWFPLFGRAEGYTSWITHDDAARAVVAALEVPPGIYNAVDDQPLRRRELADGIAILLGVSPPRLMPPWATVFGGAVGDTIARSLRISNRKLRQTGNWTPSTANALQGIAAVLARMPAGSGAAT
jgi:nucleoside-diphosphate-sugar epimerase